MEFVCGSRVLARFRQQRDVIASAVRRLSVLASDLPDAIDRLQGELRNHTSAGRGLQARLVRVEDGWELRWDRHSARPGAVWAFDAGGLVSKPAPVKPGGAISGSSFDVSAGLSACFIAEVKPT